MKTYTVTKVRKERARDLVHRHLEGVITSEGVHYTRREVFDSINAGNVWHTSAGGYRATIHAAACCQRPGCLASPYIATNPNSTNLDNLENLPEE